MNIKTKQKSAYAPSQADPLHRASATIKLSIGIGETTSEERDHAWRGPVELASPVHRLKALGVDFSGRNIIQDFGRKPQREAGMTVL